MGNRGVPWEWVGFALIVVSATIVCTLIASVLLFEN